MLIPFLVSEEMDCFYWPNRYVERKEFLRIRTKEEIEKFEKSLVSKFGLNNKTLVKQSYHSSPIELQVNGCACPDCFNCKKDILLDHIDTIRNSDIETNGTLFINESNFKSGRRESTTHLTAGQVILMGCEIDSTAKIIIDASVVTIARTLHHEDNFEFIDKENTEVILVDAEPATRRRTI